ncbi:MAG: aminopeptidase P N-terminal domain-containing protein [Gemmatimonadota bacterium]
MRPFVPALLVALGAVALPLVEAPLAAQSHDAPVRYDDDYLPASFHEGRREALMSRLPDDALAIVFGAPTRNRSNDVSFEYRQDSDFLYLTGSPEPGSALVLAPGGVEVDGRTVREILFVPPRDPSEEVWLGRRFGTERAMEQLGVELAVDATRFDELVGPWLASGSYKVHHLPLPDGVPAASELEGQLELFRRHVQPITIEEGGLTGFVLHGVLSSPSPELFTRLRALVDRGFDPAAASDPTARELAEAFVDAREYESWSRTHAELTSGHPDGTMLRALLDELRTHKTAEELTIMQKAIDMTVEAHREVMRSVEPGWHEYEIEALVEHTFKTSGAEYPAFPSIVGSGENSVILHYETNRRRTEPGDMVVIDVGAEYHGYAADVTRTVPVSGTFTDEQRAIYDVVYRAQEAGIEASLAGAPYLAPHRAAEAVMAEGMAELGLIRDETDLNGLRRFFMHATSHYLGLDVHDVGGGGPLEPGTVITVEPGLYIPAADDIDPRWWNIGVRIEDDILVTEDGPVNLSAGAPRSSEEVEALMGERP